MKFQNELTDAAVLEEIGRRLRQVRLGRNSTQRQVALEAGISEVTVYKLEHGEPTKLVTLIRLLRTLDLLEGLEAAIPEPGLSPLDELRHRGRSRRRASSIGIVQTGGGERGGPWRWGDERGGEDT